jgi:gliding motility-associated transport system ATP-binding protein
MIEVRDLVKRFGPFEALRQVAFSIAPGESVGLLGENGAGKTTTMRILSGFLPPTAGTVKVAGHDVIFESDAVRRRIGYLPENVPLYGDMRVEELLRFRARLKGLRGRAVSENIDRVVGLVQLDKRRRSLVKNLSKGLRQRVGLADALVHRPELLILDEPTSGLDPTQRIEVRDLVRSLGDAHTLLISSHILPEIEETCERVVVISEGRVVADDQLENLRRDGEAADFDLTVSGLEVANFDALLEGIEGLEVRTREETGPSIKAVLRGQGEPSATRAQVARALVQAGADLEELVPRRDRLEDLFVRLTEEGRAS